MGLRAKRILLVDDEEDLTWSIERNLRKTEKGLEIDCANTGLIALSFLEQNCYDLVISDIRMPGMSGIDLLHEIRRCYPDTPVIIITAYGNNEVEESVNLRGSLAYVEKPFEMDYLKQIINKVLNDSFEAFDGHLVNLKLTDVIGLNCRNGHTGTLRISNGVEEGVVYFRNGEVVHASCLDRQGEDALDHMLKWRKGSFFTNIGDFPIERTIDPDTRKWLEPEAKA